MSEKIKTTLLLTALVSCIIYIAGCKKSPAPPASIVGAWTASTVTGKTYVNNALVFDTTIPFSSTPFAITFNSNGFYTELTGSAIIGGAYTYTGNVLSIFDTVAQANIWEKLSISNLTANNLSIQDTSYISTDTVQLYITNLTR